MSFLSLFEKIRNFISFSIVAKNGESQSIYLVDFKLGSEQIMDSEAAYSNHTCEPFRFFSDIRSKAKYPANTARPPSAATKPKAP